MSREMHDTPWISLVMGFMVGNVTWQLLSGLHDWGQAGERTFFQTVALGCAWLVTLIRRTA